MSHELTVVAVVCHEPLAGEITLLAERRIYCSARMTLTKNESVTVGILRILLGYVEHTVVESCDDLCHGEHASYVTGMSVVCHSDTILTELASKIRELFKSFLFHKSSTFRFIYIFILFYILLTLPFIVIPPSQGMIAPLRYAPSSEARKHARFATSSGLPQRLRGVI